MESEDSGINGSKISNQSIAQEAAENKGNDGTLKKNVRYQLSEADELTKLRDEQQQLDEQRRELKEERSAWLGSDTVKEIEAKKKALGIFSAECKSLPGQRRIPELSCKAQRLQCRVRSWKTRALC